MSNLCSEVIKETYRSICRLLESNSPRCYRTVVEMPTLLDIGCWDGTATLKFAGSVGIRPPLIFGIDIFEEVIDIASSKHIQTSVVNLELEKLPFESAIFDFIICNQVFEHLKNIFLPMQEIARVTKPGGILILSVPNLAAFHNRVLLLFGKQPTCIRLFGPHVRGMTLTAIKEFATYKGLFSLKEVKGVGWHPFQGNSLPCRILASLFPGTSHTIVLVLQRTNVGYKEEWETWLADEKLQTSF